MHKIKLKKNHDRRVRMGHPWIFSNEIDIAATSIKTYTPGDEVLAFAHDNTPLGKGYVNPHSLISVRLLTRDVDENIDETWFDTQLKNALSLREKVFREPFYRLVFSEADNLPGLIIDRFNNDIVVQLNTAGMDKRCDLIISAIQRLLPNIRSILLKNDSAAREQEGLTTGIEVALGTAAETVLIQENDINFQASLLQGQKTGWFYDHRMSRARLKDYVRNEKILDVFSYVGAWGIQAAKWGAQEVVCLDSSKTACQFVLENAKLNQVQDKVSVICDDAFSGLKQLLASQKTFGVIVVDPPAFVKRSKDLKEGLLAYQRINELALKLLNPGGILISCSCSMHVSMDELIGLLKRAAHRSQCSLQILERGHQGPDHPIHLSLPETDYLKAVFVRKI